MSNAINRAKELMDGKREPSATENKWFWLQATVMEKADSEAANLLRQIANAAKAGKEDTGRVLGDGSEPASAVAGQQPAYAANPETSSSQDDPIARGQGKANIRREKGKSNPDSPKFTRSPNKQDVEFAHDFLVELSDVDELFRHTISHKTSLTGVFADVYPGAEYVGEGTRPDERDESGADHRHVFQSPQGKQFYVYERDNGEVFIDVSHFEKGQGGQDVYAAVANWAYNTKR